MTSEFNRTFKSHLITLDKNIMSQFPNFQNGARVLHSVLSRLLTYYTRFLGFHDQKFNSGMDIRRPNTSPIGIQNLMIELKKFKSNFWNIIKVCHPPYFFSSWVFLSVLPQNNERQFSHPTFKFWGRPNRLFISQKVLFLVFRTHLPSFLPTTHPLTTSPLSQKESERSPKKKLEKQVKAPSTTHSMVIFILFLFLFPPKKSFEWLCPIQFHELLQPSLCIGFQCRYHPIFSLEHLYSPRTTFCF